ncbi:hypothetical protein C8R42DRAFT_705994 [Lentinula raphanica]|nr:hypothetical protein C8R42DRAFT_711577 [Lentinula raphanica]KAJ3730213.1 hypothetical protein C8R42DRAFT_705994 [Lentinula raphanica]KAJ3825032.1 hypothetical protein F5880DRAFT_1505775 [Lentinula raphanica]
MSLFLEDLPRSDQTRPLRRANHLLIYIPEQTKITRDTIYYEARDEIRDLISIEEQVSNSIARSAPQDKFNLDLDLKEEMAAPESEVMGNNKGEMGKVKETRSLNTVLLWTHPSTTQMTSVAPVRQLQLMNSPLSLNKTMTELLRKRVLLPEISHSKKHVGQVRTRLMKRGKEKI